MDIENARDIIVEWSKVNFGKLFKVREVTIVRRATGKCFEGKLYCSVREGDVLVGTTVLNDSGEIIDAPDSDDLLDALITVRMTNSTPPGQLANEFAADDFSDLALDDNTTKDYVDEFNAAFDHLEGSSIPNKINQYIASGERSNLLKARELLPQLLSIPDTRGTVLQQMGELELLLGELDLGVNYLEAAAREYANIADVNALGQVAELSLNVLGEERFESCPVKTLLDRSRARLRPLATLSEAPLFIGMSDEEMFALQGTAEQITITSAEDLLKEGDPATTAFVVKSGILSIRLETPDGGNRIVRSCFPGDFIGESSVLGEINATCTATVRGECLSSLWKFEGAHLKELINEYPSIAVRIESARTLHRLDSFMSMHEATATLDVAVRDQLLSCINGINRAKAGTVINKAKAVPESVYLIVEGKVEYRAGDYTKIYEADTFAGLRDALHELALEGEFVTTEDSLLVKFDPLKLRKIAQEATAEVIAVLEKME